MKRLISWLAVPLAVAVVGCEAKKSSNPLSPSVAGPIPGVNITVPQTVDPAQGSQIEVAKQPITLTVQNASSSGVRPLSYSFEVATDNGFANKVFSRDGVPAGDGKTSLQLPTALPSGKTYYWHARALDGANTGSYSDPVAFSVYTPVVLQAPVLVKPINSTKVSDLLPTFQWNDAGRTGPAGIVSYTVQLAYDAGFGSIAAVWQLGEQPNTTTLQAPGMLAYAKTYYWRVSADDSSGVHSPWSATGVFSTPAAPPPPAPTPSPVPTGGGGGGACSGSTPYSVVQCRRGQYPTPMSSGQLYDFLVNVARDLNAKGFAPGGFGLLRKSSGTSCNGYSCDIICSGSGNAQQQWDVLGGADPGSGPASPQWQGPNTVPNIRVDTCTVP